MDLILFEETTISNKIKCKVILHNSMEEKFMFRKNFHIFILLL